MAETVAGPRTVRTARSIVVLTACEVIGKLGTLVIIVGVARVLPIADFGVFAVAISAGALLAVVPSWGFDPLVVQRGARSPAALPGLLAELLALRVTLIVAVMLVSGWVATDLDSLDNRILPVTLLVLACLLETLAETFRSIAIALQEAATVAIAQLVQRILAAALVLGALLVRPDLLWVSVAYLAGAVAGVVAMAAGTARLGIRPRLSHLTWSGIRELCRTSLSSGVHSLASMALFRLDAVLLAVLAGAAAAGRYAAAYRLLETVIFVAWTVARSVFPVMAAAADAAGVRRGAERALVVLASVFLPYAALLWTRGPDVMRLLYGESFGRDAAVVAWLAPAPLLFGAAYLAAFVLMASGPTPTILIGSLGALLFNTALNLVLIPSFGPAGAAAATTLAYAAETLLLYPAARRRIGRPELGFPLLPAVLASAAAGGLMLFPMPLAASLIAAAATYLVVWLACVTRFDPEQVRVVQGLWAGLAPGRSGS